METRVTDKTAQADSEIGDSLRERLTQDDIAELRSDFAANPSYRLMQNAVTQYDVNEIALDRSVVTAASHSYSNVLDSWSPTDQGNTGRCWLFAGLNLFRVDTMKALNVKQFEFSQNYAMFWDKVERANFLLESIISTADRPVDDRTVAWLMEAPLEDAGQWDMFVGLVKKHGVVPKTAMPETESSGNTHRMNSILYNVVRQGAKDIRDLYADEAGIDAMRQAKRKTLKVVYRVLCIHLGTPPSRFDWQWTDKDGQFHRDGEITPLEFAEKYVSTPVDEYVCLVNDPRKTSPMGRTYAIDFLGNVVGSPSVKYLNIDIELMKEITLRLLLEEKPVWMGCDVGKQMHRKLGMWDAQLFDYAGVYGTEFTLDKAGRLDYGQTQMTHAMLFTGVDVVDGRARRWRVENSYGEALGDKGFCMMNDSWFNEYMFEIAAPKSYLPEDLQRALDTEPILLPPWDPMGALAS
ncbi:MAG: C1 family peptidase [Chloroflexi bacterium]|nr:C1 family peptidase [Chloroflexota bacterium]